MCRRTYAIYNSVQREIFIYIYIKSARNCELKSSNENEIIKICNFLLYIDLR